MFLPSYTTLALLYFKPSSLNGPVKMLSDGVTFLLKICQLFPTSFTIKAKIFIITTWPYTICGPTPLHPHPLISDFKSAYLSSQSSSHSGVSVVYPTHLACSCLRASGLVAPLSWRSLSATIM